MNFLKNVLKPITLDIISNDRVTDLKTRVQFLVTFEIQFFFFGKRIRFETTGTLETNELIDQEALSDIVNETDYTKYMDLNIKNIEKGNFDYEYLYRDSSLTINFTTFGPQSD
jgi:hypothetical protein